MRVQRWAVLAATWVVVLVAAAPASAGGGIDRSFGVDGIVHLDPEMSYEEMQVGPEGRIYFLGRTYRCNPTCSAERHLLRLSPDASPDLEFGERGKVFLPSDSRREPAPTVLAVDAEERALVSAPTRKGVSLARLRSDGSIDTSFGRAGVQAFSCTCKVPYVTIAFDRLGRILVVINYTEYRRGRARHSLARTQIYRLLPNGSKDRSFNVVELAFKHREFPDSSLAQRGGSWVLSGRDGSPSGFYLVRIKPDGMLDRRFNRAVRRTLARLRLASSSFHRFAWVSALISRPGGTIDVLGTRSEGGFVMRILSNGRLNSRFAQKGIKRFGWRIRDAIAVGAGKAFAVGENQGRVRGAFLLDTMGNFDVSFNAGRPLTLGQLDQARGLALQGGKPLLFDSGVKGCRYSCQAEPKLIRFTIGP